MSKQEDDKYLEDKKANRKIVTWQNEWSDNMSVTECNADGKSLYAPQNP